MRCIHVKLNWDKFKDKSYVLGRQSTNYNIKFDSILIDNPMHMKINFKIILFLAKVNPKTVHVCHWQTEKNLGQNHKEPLF